VRQRRKYLSSRHPGITNSICVLARNAPTSRGKVIIKGAPCAFYFTRANASPAASRSQLTVSISFAIIIMTTVLLNDREESRSDALNSRNLQTCASDLARRYVRNISGEFLRNRTFAKFARVTVTSPPSRLVLILPFSSSEFAHQAHPPPPSSFQDEKFGLASGWHRSGSLVRAGIREKNGACRSEIFSRLQVVPCSSPSPPPPAPAPPTPGRGGGALAQVLRGLIIFVINAATVGGARSKGNYSDWRNVSD